MSKSETSNPNGALRFLVENMVDSCENVEIKEIVTDDSITYEIHVASSDLGKVIGKQGKIANALRTVTKIVAVGETRKVFVEIAA